MVVNNKPMTILKELPYITIKHPIFNIMSTYTDIDEFYVCSGYVRNC